SFTDLSLPVNGIPITVSRTYDTLTSSQSGDFGYGWRLEYGNTDLRSSEPLTGDEENGLFNSYQPWTVVFITVPAEPGDSFPSAPQPAGGLAGPFLGVINPASQAEPGVTDTLSVDPADLRQFDDGTYGDWGGGYPYNPADPVFGGNFYLTTQSGIVYT